jgi:hypothetical protein
MFFGCWGLWYGRWFRHFLLQQVVHGSWPSAYEGFLQSITPNVGGNLKLDKLFHRISAEYRFEPGG